MARLINVSDEVYEKLTGLLLLYASKIILNY